MVEKNLEVFISYTNKDERFVDTFRTHLDPLISEKLITIRDKWHFEAGVSWKDVGDRYLDSAQIILLLITPDFLSDRECIDEVKRALERQKADEARVIPIILRLANWKNAPFNTLQVLPREARAYPDKIWCSDAKTFINVVNDIREVIEGMLETENQPVEDSHEQAADRWISPPGWEHITPEYLENKRLPYSEEKLVKFFDGRLPDWDDAMALIDIRSQRTIVSELERSLEEAQQEGEIQVILLEGAAGEGKSTALRQTVCNLMRKHTGWQVWWATKVNTYLRLPLDADTLPASSSETLLIVADDASLIIGEISKAVQSLRAAYKQHVVFLLSSQKLAWQDALAAHPGWTKYVKDIQSTLPLSEISLKEAQSIVDAWSKCGEKGLGKLKNLPRLQAITSFYDQAQPGPGRGRSFLGAALTARYTRKDLERRILALLDRLSTKEAQGTTIPNGKTLVKALAFICTVDYINATRQTDDLYLFDDLKLTTDIFAHLFGCEPEQVYENFVIPLGDEAAANSAGNILYSRHQAIARVVIQHIQSLGITPSDICRRLVRAASTLYTQKKLSKRDMIPWNQLPRWFFNTEIQWLSSGANKEIGKILASEFMITEPKNPVAYVDLSTFYRAEENAEASIALLRDHFDRVNVDRKYYYEWATAEGQVGNKKGRVHHLKDIWLSGVSLADVIHKKYVAAKANLYKEDPVDIERATLSLAGLASALSNFLDQESVFLHACASAVRLGLLLNPHRDARQSAKDQTSKSLFGNKSKCEKKGIVFPYQKLSQDDCLKELLNIQKGIVAAYTQCQDELPPDVPKGDRLMFQKLKKCVFEYCAKP